MKWCIEVHKVLCYFSVVSSSGGGQRTARKRNLSMAGAETGKLDRKRKLSMAGAETGKLDRNRNLSMAEAETGKLDRKRNLSMVGQIWIS